MFNIRLFNNLSILRKSHAVYKIINFQTLEVEFVGIEKFTQLFQMREFQQNPTLTKYVKDGESFMFEVSDICENKGQAIKQQALRIREAGYPMANRMARLSMMGVIECIDDGQQYRTQEEVCTTYGISQPSLSKHLRNTPGHNHVGGLTFRRINNFAKM